jgi:hypothetical protein
MEGDAQGVLAIWNDIRSGREGEFERWYKTEHFPERLAVPGFRLGRRYEALRGKPRFFCYYLTETPDTLASPAYLARLNDPTPLTRAIMSDGFRHMNRTACRRAARFGAMWGAYCVTARLERPPDASAASAALAALAAEEGIARCELWTAQEVGGAAALEERLRGGDRKIAACAIVETLREADAERAGEAVSRTFGTAAEVGIYRLLCEIGRAASS